MCERQNSDCGFHNNAIFDCRLFCFCEPAECTCVCVFGQFTRENLPNTAPIEEHHLVRSMHHKKKSKCEKWGSWRLQLVCCCCQPRAMVLPLRSQVRTMFRAGLVTAKNDMYQDSLSVWSKALAQGASPQGRGFEPHSRHMRGSRAEYT